MGLVAREFMDDARQTAYVLGMPDLAIIEMPRGLTNLTPGEVLEIAANLKPQVVAALTSNGGGRASSDLLPSPSPDWLTYTGKDQLGALAAFQADFLDRRFGDGLPLLPPTAEAVEEMLTGTSWERDRLVAVLEPALGSATVEKIAINAVMAGCRPEHLPVVLAATEAIAVPGFCLRATAMSTGPHAPLLVVNGPIASRIGMNSGRGALGPCRESAVNMVIGRALRLVMVNCGYAYLGLFDLDTIGAPRKFSYCLAENEAASPFVPYHVDRGFAPGESTVSVLSDRFRDRCRRSGQLRARGAAADLRRFRRVVGGAVHPARLPGTQPRHLQAAEPDARPSRSCQGASPMLGWSKQDAIDYVYRESFKEARLVLAACKPQAFRKEKLWATELDPTHQDPQHGRGGLPASRRGRRGGRERPVSRRDQRARHRVNRPLPGLSRRPDQADVERPGSARRPQ